MDEAEWTAASGHKHRSATNKQSTRWYPKKQQVLIDEEKEEEKEEAEEEKGA